MSRRVKRPHFSHEDERKLLEALGAARDWVSKCGAGAEVSSPRYRTCKAIQSAIDGLAEELTGDRGYFCLKAHSTPTTYRDEKPKP